LSASVTCDSYDVFTRDLDFLSRVTLRIEKSTCGLTPLSACAHFLLDRLFSSYEDQFMTSNLLRRGVLLVLILALPLSAKVRSKADPKTDFSVHKTYIWVAGLHAQREVTDYLIRATIDHQMQRRGLQLIEDKDKADLWIHYELGIDGEIHVTAADPTYITVGGMPMTYSSTFAIHGNAGGGIMSKGAIGVEVFDRKRHCLIYLASATEGLDTQRHREGQLEKAVTKMFEKYPVKPLHD
jgi:hypothetical protein